MITVGRLERANPGRPVPLSMFATVANAVISLWQLCRPVSTIAGPLGGGRVEAEWFKRDRENEARFGGRAASTEKRQRARPARTTLAPAGKRGGRGSKKAPGLSISEASLKAVQAHGEGATPAQLLNYLSREFGMTVRPNHLGAALRRHRRAGQLENRDQR